MIQFYKPNPRNSGSACSFYRTRDGSLMFSMIKQSSWNEQKKTGSFQANKDNPKGNVKIKLSLAEAAGFIDSIEKDIESKEYHDSQNQTTQIRLAPYLDKEGQKKGFSLGVNKTSKDTQEKLSFIIGLTFKEARLLKQYLIYVINDSFENPKNGKPQDSESEGESDNGSQNKSTYQKKQSPASEPNSVIDDEW